MKKQHITPTALIPALAIALTTHRKALLEQLHQEEKRIDCLDYLLYQIQSKQSK